MKSTCDLCGIRDERVRHGLVIWKDLAQPYNDIDRCEDHDACRERVILQGNEWPILDRTPIRHPGSGVK
jgi:hypothetical protein